MRSCSTFGSASTTGSRSATVRLERRTFRIALMSGDSSAEEARERAVGLTDYFLPKPVSIPEVTSMLETLLGR